MARGFVLSHDRYACFGRSSVASSMALLASWISMERSMDELEDLKQCSLDLGDMSLTQSTEERDIPKPCDRDPLPIGVVVSRLSSSHVRSRSCRTCARRFWKDLTETECIS
jgi:hypothetical protein